MVVGLLPLMFQGALLGVLYCSGQAPWYWLKTSIFMWQATTIYRSQSSRHDGYLEIMKQLSIYIHWGKVTEGLCHDSTVKVGPLFVRFRMPSAPLEPRKWMVFSASQHPGLCEEQHMRREEPEKAQEWMRTLEAREEHTPPSHQHWACTWYSL